ncbi:MAG: Unknown protein [uncultured Sulfurovum sp.]|uniref:Serine protease n=1 Tax=uncultured Sulfurovum sp. TaxID=269237 RepID=A0A6S6SL37_9BACT|nr:MAG: Unknown protein [uncultured Sulfurovum sp.]
MKSSVVNIESVSNNAFGTGFVIHSDTTGIFVLTCQHVLDDVKTPVVENVLAKVIAKGNFIDMAVLYVPNLHLEAMPLQTSSCDQLDVDVIGFSAFNKTLTQKKHINATLYEEAIELHSKKEKAYCSIHKIKAQDGFNFDRGNSGSPVICKHTSHVIAMISNKEGSDIAYAIDIEHLKRIWKKVPQQLFQDPEKNIPKPLKQVSTQQENTETLKARVLNAKFSFSKKKSIIIAIVLLSLGSYFLYSHYQKEHNKTQAPSKLNNKPIEKPKPPIPLEPKE